MKSRYKVVKDDKGLRYNIVSIIKVAADAFEVDLKKPYSKNLRQVVMTKDELEKCLIK